MSDNARPVRRIPVHPEYLAWSFTTGRIAQIIEGLPEGTRLIRAGYSDTSDQLFLIVEHDSFPLVKIGDVIPDFSPTFRCAMPKPEPVTEQPDAAAAEPSAN
jgi:hypothetical protein